MNRLKLYPIFSLLLAFIGVACNDREIDKTTESYSTDYFVDGLYFSLTTRETGQEDEFPPVNSGERDGDEGDKNYTDTDKIQDDSALSDEEKLRKYIPYTLELDKNSVVFISQQTERKFPFQNNDDIYDFRYIENTGATWEQGYNFTPRTMTSPLEWFKIGNGGTYLGGFSLYALYFPGRDYLNQKELDGSIVYSVESDQSSLENLIKSDILGAYHSTQELFTRLRFKLYHLMTYVRIRLYVPVYDPESRTGYYDNSLVSANLNHVSADFAVEWSYMCHSDDEGPAIAPLIGDGHITMYQHPLPEGEASREPVLIPYKNFIPDDFYDQGIDGDYDSVRVYDFSVIMPPQKDVVDEDGNIIQFNQSDFLTFEFQSNAGARNLYKFDASLIGSVDGSLQLNQGNFQLLELYVPRVGDKLIYIGGNLHSWQHHTSTFPMGESEDNDNEN